MQKEEQKKPAISRDNIGFISLQPFKMFKDVFFLCFQRFQVNLGPVCSLYADEESQRRTE